MTEIALPRVRTRRRKPWSSWTKFCLATALFCLVGGGAELTIVTVVPVGVAEVELVCGTTGLIGSAFWWREFQRSRRRDEDD